MLLEKQPLAPVKWGRPTASQPSVWEDSFLLLLISSIALQSIISSVPRCALQFFLSIGHQIVDKGMEENGSLAGGFTGDIKRLW